MRQRPSSTPACSRVSSSSLLVLLVLCASLLHRGNAQEKEYPGYARGKIFLQQPEGIITDALRARQQREGDVVEPVHAMLNFFKEYTKQVSDNLQRQDAGEEDTGEVASSTCNMQDSDWGKRANSYLYVRGLNETTTDCATAREIKGGPKTNYPNLMLWLPRWGEVLNASAAAIAAASGRVLRNAAGVSRFWYPDRENSNCTLWHAMGVRREGRWYLQARITADNTSQLANDAPRGARTDNVYLIEHLTVTDDRLAQPLLMTRLPLDANASAFGRSTTSFEVDARPAPDSVGVNADISRNLAFRAALAEGDNYHQQAQDAEQVSNTAILLLPLAMNLVPVALIADVNTFGMLLYTALTDVLTTVPLCIKGVELINISRTRFRAVSAQITGNVTQPAATLVAEAWFAQCRLKEHNAHLTRGVVFVVLSLSLMCFGVACEVVAKWWVKRRKSLQIPVAPEAAPYGASTSYQPFTAAAMTLQQRVASRGGAAQPMLPSQHSALPRHAPPAGSMHYQDGVQPNPQVTNAVCVCHTNPDTRPEYHSRAHPDLLDRKYH